jgi:hypothetical protein
MDRNIERTGQVKINANDLKEIKGFDLKIDENIQKLCEVSNSSSSTSRGVLYVLLLICIICIISVINSFSLPEMKEKGKYSFFGIPINHNLNWLSERKQKLVDDLAMIRDSLAYYDTVKVTDCIDTTINKCKIATLKHNQWFNQRKWESIVKNEGENLYTIRIPIIGNSFDINNLAVFTGMSFICVLIVLWVTIRREKKNLRIALYAVSDRYPNVDDFNKYLAVADITGDWKFMDDHEKGKIGTKFLDEFNLTRRKHHYNFLSMNEMYTVPVDLLDDEKDKSNFRQTILGNIIVRYFYAFPFVCYGVVFCNDLLSIQAGFTYSAPHTVFQIFTTFVNLAIIAYLCEKCNKEKTTAQSFYDGFKKNNFIFDTQKPEKDFLQNSDLRPGLLKRILLFLLVVLLAITVYLLYAHLHGPGVKA